MNKVTFSFVFTRASYVTAICENCENWQVRTGRMTVVAGALDELELICRSAMHQLLNVQYEEVA